MRRRAAVAATLLTFGAACTSTAPGLTIGDATGTTVGTVEAPAIDVALTLRSATADELSSVSVSPSFAATAEITAISGTSGGDGHLGHLDPDVGGTHTHGGKVAVDLPAGEEVAIGEGGAARIRIIGLVSDPRPGESFDLTLGFDRAPGRTVTVTLG